MQLCVSHQAILSKMDEMAAGFELRIQQWQDCIVKELLRKCTCLKFKTAYNNMYTYFYGLCMVVSYKYRWW